MKFNCTTCKTRYSISDDRVQGKILKIRCKNCSSIIEVTKASPVEPSQSGDVSRAKESHAKPPRRGEKVDEWYLAIDGDQSGPFTLVEAQRWVRGKPAGISIHCWSEGFDGWKLTESVDHFRGLKGKTRSQTAKPGAKPASGDDLRSQKMLDPITEPVGAGQKDQGQEQDEEEDWAKDVSTKIDTKASGLDGLDDLSASLRALKKGEPSSEESALPLLAPGRAISEPAVLASEKQANSQGLFDEVESSSDGLDFDIGEASRVVQLPDLLARMPMSGAMAHGGEASASGAAAFEPVALGGAAPAAEVKPEEKKRRGILIAFLAVTSIAAIGGAIFAISRSRAAEDPAISRGKFAGGDNLGMQFQTPGRTKIIVKEVASEDKAATRRTVRKTTTRNGGSGGKGTEITTVVTPRSSSDEVSLGGGAVATGPLDGSDLSKVVRKNQFLFKRCFERALKKDPFLRVQKADVAIQVSPKGKVSSVKIPSLSGTVLGTCIQSSIRRWKFRTSSETFNGQFPIVFGQ